MTLNKVFSSRMVLQANERVNFFGEGEGHAKIQVGNIVKESDSQNGKWLITFDPFDYGGPYVVSVDLNGQKTVLEDVFFGDVILLSGQSNIQFKLNESSTKQETYESNENIRYFSLVRPESEDYFKPEDGWVKLDKKTAGYWSAVGYHTAIELQKRTGHKIGMIACFQGASSIQSWLPKEVALEDRFYLPANQKFWDINHEVFGKWNGAGFLHENMTEKIAGFVLSNVIWYQGESDTTIYEAKIYPDMLVELVKSHKKDFCNNNIKETIVQIADYDERKNDAGWIAIQEAEIEAVKRIDCAELVVCRDVCESNDIHPRTKEKLSLRIAESILKNGSVKY